MEENIKIITYSVSDFKKWLLHNHTENGLSDSVIAPARAYSIINNPFVTDDTQVVCALFVNDRVAAFTAAFPEVLQKPENRLAWWFSTLWCEPEYAGRGFGLAVIGTMCELIGEGNFFDAEGAKETVEIFKMLGLKNTYIPRYVFSGRSINTATIRGKLAWFRELLSKKQCDRRRRILMHEAGVDSSYVVKYSRFIDDATYAFMEEHSHEDVILRKQETFNWILQHPFAQVSPLFDRVPFDNRFSSTVKDYQSLCCKVYVGDKLVGVSMLVITGCAMSVKYLYYEKDLENNVFQAIVDHVLTLRINKFETNDEKLSEYIKALRIFTKSTIFPRSFSHPQQFEFLAEKKLQAGEGDMFV